MALGTREALTGCLLGCAVGDSMGLPYEGLSRRRAGAWLRRPLAQRFVFGRGMVSDDTDHTVFVAQAILVSEGDVRVFRKALATRLRLWLATLPAGIGLATLRSLTLLCLGVPPTHSGVRSAGNGPSMRSAIIGCHFASDAARRHAFVEASTAITHRDEIALAGAMAISEVAACLARGDWTGKPPLAELIAVLRRVADASDWQAAVLRIEDACLAAQPMDTASQHFGTTGISGYTLHSVPFALVAWYTHFGNFAGMLEAIFLAGGDTDTIGAIAGALCGITVGPAGIPNQWIEDISDWPHGVGTLRELAAMLSGVRAIQGVGFRPGLFPRSPVFMVIVLTHGLRRCLPPY